MNATDMVREDMIKVLSELQGFREEHPAMYTPCSSHEISLHITAQGTYIFPFHVYSEDYSSIYIKPYHM